MPIPHFTLRQVGVGDGAVADCTAVPTPALLFHDVAGPPPNQAAYLLYGIEGETTCRLTLAARPQTTQVAFANGLFYYAVYDAVGSHYVIWQDDGLGHGRALPFTQTPIGDLNLTHFRFLVAGDGAQLAWSLSTYEGGEWQTAHNQLWAADMDGLNLRQLRDHRDNGGNSYYDPIRFTAEGRLLYAHQPLGLGGRWNGFVGRYQNLYQLDLNGDEPELIFACDWLLCLGDVSADGRYLVYTDPTARVIHLVTWAGDLVQSITPPGQAYAGYPTFADDGRLFFTSADFDASFNTVPGYLSVLSPPYNGPAEIFHQADNLTIISQIAGNNLLYRQDYEITRLNLALPHEIVQFVGGRFQGALP